MNIVKMSTQNSYQTILGADGEPAFVVLPYADFVKLPGAVKTGTVTNLMVSRRSMGDVGLLQAWREHLMLTQAEVAERMGISQAGYAQIEASKRPRKVTLQKAARALGISLEQLVY
jgi:DNA-binding XRE family transcriptional regulator